MLDDEVERLDLFTHEVLDPIELLLELRLRLEVPRHGFPSPPVATSSHGRALDVTKIHYHRSM
jgi:hypothetical protein